MDTKINEGKIMDTINCIMDTVNCRCKIVNTPEYLYSKLNTQMKRVAYKNMIQPPDKQLTILPVTSIAYQYNNNIKIALPTATVNIRSNKKSVYEYSQRFWKETHKQLIINRLKAR